MMKKAINDGLIGQFAPIEVEILRFVFKLHEQGMAVSSHLIVIKVSILDLVFAAKSPSAKYSVVRRFTKAHLITACAGEGGSRGKQLHGCGPTTCCWTTL